MLACEVWFSFSLSPSAGCGPPSPPVNGSVDEWTSSRVGAQVTYSCDTDLALVGERVAYCSVPQLQWLPSSDDVVCVQSLPGISFCMYYSNYTSLSATRSSSIAHTIPTPSPSPSKPLSTIPLSVAFCSNRSK